ncbi:uncharacterized protein [Linepithema humile]|uniref:uncharacterized protein isoform X1 n=2 Tax=Linepithema humile TaxID=83485 RepID=UPI00351E45E4
MKEYVIIHDSSNKKKVYPSLWITEDLKHVRIPPEGSVNLKQSKIDKIIPKNDWEKIPILKIIKENDSYIEATEFLNIDGISELSDANDAIKLKTSRAKRKSKSMKDYVQEPLTKKSKVDKTSASKSFKDTDKSDENVNQKNSYVPPTLNVNNMTRESKTQCDKIDFSIDHDDSDEYNSREHSDDNSITSGEIEMELPRYKSSDVNSSYNKLLTASDKRSLASTIESGPSIDSDDGMSGQKILQKPESVESKIVEPTNSQLLEVLRNISKKQTKLLKNLHQLSLKQENTDKLIKSLKVSNEMRATSNTPISSVTQQKLCEEYFPIGDPNKTIQKLEQKLMRKNFTLNVIDYMKSIGGNNEGNFISNIFQRIILDSALKNYSFVGQKINQETKIKNESFKELSFCKCMFEAAKQLFPAITEEAIKKKYLVIWTQNKLV